MTMRIEDRAQCQPPQSTFRQRTNLGRSHQGVPQPLAVGLQGDHCYASLHLTESDDIPENLVSKWACAIGYDPLAPNRYTQKSGESPDVIIFDGPAACWGSE